jgi:uncharacterized protein YbaA (DUF1428 family)
MSYVDGFVLCVKRNRLEDFRKMAEVGKTVWMDHGALDYKECVLDADNPGAEDGSGLSFTELSGATDDEVTVFSFIIYRDKLHREEVNAKVMADPRMSPDQFDPNDMPFDMKRMAFGGFAGLVEA